MSIIIRRATPADIEAIGRLVIDVWRETYRGILSDYVLATQTVPVGERSIRFVGLDSDGSGRAALVAERAGAIVGFAAAGPATDGSLGTAAEIAPPYVARRLQFRGIGGRLMGGLAHALMASGHASAGLWIPRDNVAAVAFARALGGTVAGTRSTCAGETMLEEIAVIWPDLNDLAVWHEEPVALSRAGRAAPGLAASDIVAADALARLRPGG
ncbi:GNAT family N-acetyltransferase [Chelatococcus daeguensis]|uniref:N-acetyltransferase domain-containing protein n=2 Tax=Chelatococcus TaxID=28209 RepID=A0AAC9P0H2_9HYPH|nr:MULTISPECIES: GNAT family N-acetyltransferase [Chelatococcus]APF38661.1 hypothetical protein BOQ54_16125 [Chelatococcus daeguensis]KZE36215.1 hypothetical protein AVW15_10550 [Chelatococcus daeguensis]MBM3084315.1 GNAT family N-acetyltransferase [Chelatococcus daeguensis]CUA89455.1 L-amino acid N-acyltransferase YncA [Chelatococcus sambhunathii]